MEIKFWGLRGSYPMCSRDILEFGGNTMCVSVEVDNKLFIFDSGSGIINLGKDLYEKYNEFYIFISHTHSDHIMGLSFFKPIYDKEKKVYIYGPSTNNKDFKELILNYFSIEYYPLTFEKLPGLVEINNFNFEMNIGKVKIKGIEMQKHPKFGVLIYKLTYDELNIVYGTDLEFSIEIDLEFQKFIENIDLLMHDGTYTEENYHLYKGWGHSTYESAIKNSNLANVKNLYLIHYNNEDTDDILKERERYIKKNHKNVNLPREGDTIII